MWVGNTTGETICRATGSKIAKMTKSFEFIFSHEMIMNDHCGSFPLPDYNNSKATPLTLPPSEACSGANV